MLMWWIIAASVVDLPEPVVPVTSTMPRCSSASAAITGGSASSSIVRIRCGIARATIETPPRWWKALTRKRATPGISCERSISRSRVELGHSARRSPSSCLQRPSVSAGVEHRPGVVAQRARARRRRGRAGSSRPSGAGRSRHTRRARTSAWSISITALSGSARQRRRLTRSDAIVMDGLPHPRARSGMHWPAGRSCSAGRRLRRRREASAPRRGSGASSATGSRSGGSARA